MKITQKLGTPTNVAASGHFVSVLPIGLSFEEIYLVGTGSFVLAEFTNLKLIANNKPIQEYRTGTELDVYNKFNKRTVATTNSILVVDLNRRLLKTREACELTKLGTGKPANLNQYLDAAKTQPNPDYNPYPVQTLTFEGDLASTFAASATLTVYARQSAPAATGLIRKVRPITLGPTANPFEWPDIPKGDLINAIYMKDPTGGPVTGVIVLRDNYKIFERSNTLNNLIQTDDNVRTPQSGYFVIDTTETGNGTEVIATSGVSDFRLQITCSAAPSGNFNTTVDFIGNLDR